MAELNKRQKLELDIINNKRQAIKLQLEQLSNREKEIILGKHAVNTTDVDDEVLVKMKRSVGIALGLVKRKY